MLTKVVGLSKKSSPKSSDFLKIVRQHYQTFQKKFAKVPGLSEKNRPGGVPPLAMVYGVVPHTRIHINSNPIPREIITDQRQPG
jgi:hypothetical protein